MEHGTFEPLFVEVVYGESEPIYFTVPPVETQPELNTARSDELVASAIRCLTAEDDG